MIDEIKAALLVCEPQTPTEIARKINKDRRSVQLKLFKLILDEKNGIRYKKIGPYYLFWLKPK
jgi:predicted transcriptional regulator